MFITVFTPTFNRASYLDKLYQSLVRQTFKDFEWVIVDDGSADNTKDVVKKFIGDNLLSIQYVCKNNEGKHIAINKGAQVAKGKLFFTVDSDDYLTSDSLERIYHHWMAVENLPENEKEWMIGVSGHRLNPDGTIIGGAVDYNVLDIDLLDFRFKLNIKGDKAEVYLTDVVRKNPFPKFEGENFCPEALIYYRLANKGYKLRQFNEGIYVGEYLEGGLTHTALNTTKKNIVGALYGYADMVNFPKVPLVVRMKYAILFWRFSFWAKQYSFFKKLQLLNNKLFVVFHMPGYFMYLRDRNQNK